MFARNIESKKYREVVTDGADLGAEFGAHDHAIAVNGRREHREETRQAFVGLRHGPIRLVGAAGEHNNACCYEAGFVGDDANDAAVLSCEAERTRAELDRYAADQKLLDEMGDDPHAPGPDFLASAMLQDVLRPIVSSVVVEDAFYHSSVLFCS